MYSICKLVHICTCVYKWIDACDRNNGNGKYQGDSKVLNATWPVTYCWFLPLRI